MDPGKEPSSDPEISWRSAHLGNILIAPDDAEYRQPGQVFLYKR